MAEYTGSALYLLWKGIALEADYRTFTPNEAYDTEDGSAGSDTHRIKYATLADGAASAEFVAQAGTAGTAQWDAIAPGPTAGSLEWGPEGTAVGNRRSHVQAILTSREETVAYDGVTTWAVEWEYSDADGPTHTAYS